MNRPSWILAATLALSSGSLPAAPVECLSYSDNPRVAACANQYGYGPSAAGLRPRSSTPAEPARSVPVGKDAELRTVAVNREPKPAPPPEPGPLTFDVDRSGLINTVLAGAAGALLLVLAAFGVWRWGPTLKKACPYCGSKLGLKATSCRRCFRAV